MVGGSTRRRDRRRRDERGAAAIEFAFLVPIVLMILFAIISYGYMFSFRQTLSQAASEGARASLGGQVGTACPTAGPYTAACPAQYAAAQAVANALGSYSMACNSGYLTCSISAPTAVGCPTGHTCVSVTVSYPYRSHSLLATIPGLGFTMPSSLSFSSSVESS